MGSDRLSVLMVAGLVWLLHLMATLICMSRSNQLLFGPLPDWAADQRQWGHEFFYWSSLVLGFPLATPCIATGTGCAATLPAAINSAFWAWLIAATSMAIYRRLGATVPDSDDPGSRME